MGRPTLYKPEFVRQAAKLSRMGATLVDLANFFEVNIVTIHRWMTTIPEFCNAIRLAKEEANSRVERSLYEKAMGYSFDAEKIFCNKNGKIVRAPYREHVPPSDTAMIFWLKNRRPDLWRDRQDINHAGQDGAPLQIANIQVVIVDPKKEDQALIEGDYERVN